jgi:beta-hydroxylase
MHTIVFLTVIYISCIVFIRQRNKSKFALVRQLSDFSTFMVPFNIPAYLLSKVPLTHFVAPEHFPELKIIEDNWQEIRDEALALYDNGLIAAKDDLPGSSFYKDNRWTSFYLKNFNNDIPSAYDLAPKTMALINQVPSMSMAVFACLNPGKRINNHHDPFAFTLRYSLGLSTPNSDKSGLIVNGEDYKWSDGEGILFDETYMHSAYNDSDKPRIILMTDIDRPLKSSFFQKFYFLFGHYFNSLFAIDNVDASKTSIGNKFGYYLNIYKAFMKRFKHWNKPIYVTSKVVVLFAVLAYIFI